MATNNLHTHCPIEEDLFGAHHFKPEQKRNGRYICLIEHLLCH